ncbi:MAG: HAD hydrolase-like protein [Verrucomicrobia bacterium]|nr:HAD hydrolase-like protein [Verrucomicrobiota bacterium]
MRTLILFDIDGTLLDTRGAGRRSFARAIRHIFGGQDDLADLSFAGATDLDLFEKVALRFGRRATRDDCALFFDILPGLLAEELQQEPPNLYPGVSVILEDLSTQAHCTLGLVTGNIETCARVKLKACNIHQHFVLGAFGHEHADRREIARLARERAERTRRHDRCFLIGDTPSDIAAAHAIGAVSVAVATGIYTAEQLAAAGAAHVWENLDAHAERARSILLSA